MSKKRLTLIMVVAGLGPGLAVGLDEDTGDRENYVLRGTGTVLAVKQECFGSDTDNACLVRRVPDGAGGFTEQELLRTGQTFGSTTIEGIGSNPFMNNKGVMATQIALNTKNISKYTRNGTDATPTWDTAMVTGIPGTLTTIAKTLDMVAGYQVCGMEPWPQINENNQVFWGTTLVTNSLCPEDGGREKGGQPEHKAVYRFTPPSTQTLMLRAGLQGGADTVTTNDNRWVTANTTFNLVDAHLIAQGGNTVTDSGKALVRVWLSTSTTLTNADPNPGGNPTCVPQGYVWTDGTTRQLVAMEAGGSSGAPLNCPPGNNGPYTTATTNRPFGYLGKAVANEENRVFFLTQRADDNQDDDDVANLWLWSATGGLPPNPVVKTGDPIPGGSTGVFNGFAPHQDLNDANQAAFTAGLNIDGGTICGNESTTNLADFCRGVYFVNVNGSKIEIARTTAAAQADPTTASRSSLGGFNFDSIGSAAVLAPNGTVFFVAARGYPTSPDPFLDPSNPNDGVGYGNSQNGIFAWKAGKLYKLIAEGDDIAALITNGQIMAEADHLGTWLTRLRSTAFHAISGLLGIEPAQAATPMIVERLFLPMPELRQQTNDEGKFVVRAWLDTTGDGTADEEKMLLLAINDQNKAGAFWNNACHLFGGCGN